MTLQPPRPHTAGRTDLLPTASAEEMLHSKKLAQAIQNEIATAGGSIDFARYMELALYAHGLGYYSADQQKFGAGGDFVTAPELTPIFSRCLARQCRQVMEQLTPPNILEVGAGSGSMAAELLLELERLDALPQTYFILELSMELRQRQIVLLTKKAPHLRERVHWLESFPDGGFEGVILGNEVLDAMPVQRFHIGRDGPQLLHIAQENGKFIWRTVPADNRLADYLQPLGLPEDYRSEINFYAQAWIRSMAERMATGVMLLIDYGFPRTEFYHPQRSDGTLMCHYRHRAHDDPLILPGLQDITTHIDFTAVAEAATESGLSVLGYTSQAAFLIGCGLEEVINHATTENTGKQISLVHNVNKLTSPAEMGELYKVIALGVNMDEPLLGFQHQDRRGSL